jgi:dolichyl-phosphate-mannose--protein O-mannosyl transferase
MSLWATSFVIDEICYCPLNRKGFPEKQNKTETVIKAFSFISLFVCVLLIAFYAQFTIKQQIGMDEKRFNKEYEERIESEDLIKHCHGVKENFIYRNKLAGYRARD